MNVVGSSLPKALSLYEALYMEQCFIKPSLWIVIYEWCHQDQWPGRGGGGSLSSVLSQALLVYSIMDKKMGWGKVPQKIWPRKSHRMETSSKHSVTLYREHILVMFPHFLHLVNGDSHRGFTRSWRKPLVKVPCHFTEDQYISWIFLSKRVVSIVIVLKAVNGQELFSKWNMFNGMINKMLLTISNTHKSTDGSLKRQRKFYIILIIHISSCISGSATCIEDIYNVANWTRRLCRLVRFVKHCECLKSCCTAANAWRISVLLVL